MESIPSIILALRKVDRLQISKEKRRKIRKTYLRAIVLNRHDSSNRIVDVAGYEMKYCTFHSLRYLFSEIFLKQEYLFEADTDCPVILDCGSNIGMSVFYFKLIYPNSRIIAFEPDPEAFRCLKHNVESNQLGSVSVHQKAVSDEEEEIDFFYDKENPGSLVMSAVGERMPGSSRKVESVRLSAYIDGRIDFLKMDIEGSEQKVVGELADSGKLGRIKQIAIEYHHHIVREKDELSEMLQLLEGAGFGYQIEGQLPRPLAREQYQDVLIYAYKK